jgi:hypothetical protein
MSVFWRDDPGGVFVTHWSEGDPRWQTTRIESPLGAGAFGYSRMAAISRSPEHLEVFYLTPLGALKNAWNYHGPGTPWSTGELVPAGSVSLRGGVSALSRRSDHMEVFWITPNGAVKNAWFYDDGQGPLWESGEISGQGSAAVATGSLNV